MARIRTVKPGLFRHEALYELEKRTNLPIRVAWMGLFTVADREGRFEWKPNILKLDILPWDEVDFNLILEALNSAGFIRHYDVNGKRYGYIPTWNDHQKPHHTEQESRIPDPEVFDRPLANGEFSDQEPLTHRCSPFKHRQEEEEEEEEEKEVNILSKPKFDFDEIYREYPRKEGKHEGIKSLKSQIKTQSQYNDLLQAVRIYRSQCEREGKEKKFIKIFSSFVSGGKWRDWLEPDVGTSTVSSIEEPISIAKILASKGEAYESSAVRQADPKACK